MAMRIVLFILCFLIPVFIIVHSQKLSSRMKDQPLPGQIWKLTGFMLLPATVIVSVLSFFHPGRTQLIITACVLAMQLIILLFLERSVKRFQEEKEQP